MMIPQHRRCTIPLRLLPVALATTALACHGNADARAADAPPQTRVIEVSDSAGITVPHPEAFPVVAVAFRAVRDQLSRTCVVGSDVNRSVPVNALGSGRVVDLRVSLGDRVRKGQLLVTIDSPDLLGARSDYRKAVADESLARRQLDRSRLLYSHGSIAQKDLEAAEDAETKAQVDLQATADHVRMLGGNPAQHVPYMELRAPIDGTIIEQNVTPASGVKSPDNAQNLFTIADLSRVWILCDVYEKDLPHIRAGDLARIRLNGYPDRTFAGRIGNVAQVLDPATRTAKVRVELANPGRIMRPGMFAVAELESPAARDRLVLPTTAIVQMHDAEWVFVRLGSATFRREQVRTGQEVEPGVQEILEGVTPGEEVVRDALQFVQSAGR